MNAPIPDGWTSTPHDEAAAAELASWLPDRLFDAHVHVYRQDHLSPVPRFVAWGPEEAGVETWRREVERLTGLGRLQGGLLMPFPSPGRDPEAANDYLLRESARAPDCAAGILVAPDSDEKRVRDLIESPRVRAIKPYHYFSRRPATFDSLIGEFLPDWVCRLAGERGLSVVLHMVRSRALSDPENQREIGRICRSYPGLKLVLAHAARGFHAPNTVKGVQALRGLENVWFDAAAVCEAEPLLAILDEFGAARLMWGTDFPVSQQRGRCVTLGDGFAWIVTDLVDWNDKAFAGNAITVGLESLRALRTAAERFGASRGDLENIFWNNGRRVFGLGQ